MQKNGYLLSALCVLSMVILLGLQAYWIHKFYGLTKDNFEKEVNLAFEDAVKKEFNNRADTIAEVLAARIIDTNQIIQPQKPDANLKDTDLLVKQKIANNFTHILKNENLENDIVYYRMQELNAAMVKITKEMEFDTARLRPILNRYLAERSIFINYQFYVKDQDSTTNKSSFSPALIQKYPIITRALPTYRVKPGQNYVRAMFMNPFPYILSNMWLILTASIFLTLLIAFCLNYLLKSLRKEKKLAIIKNDFISNITHEFKTPIATALLAVEALNDKIILYDEEKASRYLKHTKSELIRISGLTDQILKLALYENNGYEIKREQTQIEPIIWEIIALHSLSKKDIKISFENNTKQTSILVDKVHFQHAISNIIENSIKYGQDPIEIKISCSLDATYFIISITDNGPGISPSELPFVFDKFYRAKQENSELIKGYGLGLNYVKQIMDQHAGSYQLTSSKNGTELKLSWPL